MAAVRDSAIEKEDSMTVLIKNEPGLTTTMLNNWTTAAQTFQTRVLTNIDLTNGTKNQVVLWGISQKTLGSDVKDVYGSTSFYLANGAYDGCVDGDHANFTEAWSIKLTAKDSVPADVAVRMVIAVNLTLHRSQAQIYATLLHEWLIHATRWSGVIEYIRNGKGAFALAWVQGQGAIRREAGEHAQYKDWTDEQITTAVNQLGLETAEAEKVIATIIKDRNRY
jgi:hypothetical protein